MIIVVWSSLGPLALLLDDDVFKSFMTIFITCAFLSFLQGTFFFLLYLHMDIEKWN